MANALKIGGRAVSRLGAAVANAPWAIKDVTNLGAITIVASGVTDANGYFASGAVLDDTKVYRIEVTYDQVNNYKAIRDLASAQFDHLQVRGRFHVQGTTTPVVFDGPISSTAKGHVLGSTDADVLAAPVVTDYSLALYSIGANNWGGLGVSSGGDIAVRTGNQGSAIAPQWVFYRSGEFLIGQVAPFNGNLLNVNGRAVVGAGGLQLGQSGTAADNFHEVVDTVATKLGRRMYNGNYGAGTHLLTVRPNGYWGLGPSQQDPATRLAVEDGVDEIVRLVRTGQAQQWGIGVGQTTNAGKFFIGRPGSRDVEVATDGSLLSRGESVPRVKTGFYTGDGTSPRTITVGFTPSMVMLFETSSAGQSPSSWLMLYAPGAPDANVAIWHKGISGDPNHAFVSGMGITTNGFIIGTGGNPGFAGNNNTWKYQWVAFG